MSGNKENWIHLMRAPSCRLAVSLLTALPLLVLLPSGAIAEDVTITSPAGGSTVPSPISVRAHSSGCGGHTPVSFGYSVDNSSVLTLGATASDIDTTDKAIPAGTHTIHFKSWTGDGECPSVTTTFTTGSAETDHTIPADAISSGDLDGSSHWEWNHDPGTQGDSVGSTSYPVSNPSLDKAARVLDVAYSDHGGEIYHLSFANDPDADHFVYETYIYLTNPSQVENIEMDMNQTMSDGRTVILGTQCASGSGTWEYTLASGGTHWHPSNIPCHAKDWTANTWHHVQIATHRDSNGVATYDWVNLDGTYSNFYDASGPSAESLGWARGHLLLNFQLDGSSASSGSIKAYIDKMTMYHW